MTTDNKPATDTSHFKTSVPFKFKLDTKNMVHTLCFAPTCTGMSRAEPGCRAVHGALWSPPSSFHP